ncbi:MAG: hypothetical protein A2X08_11570 [Bacteroidetes bacterium GWA2_32_17]|nr:MAG: hypothetical protein A2X08_11570 [Bacteroidetes bacterium GWA2_32_17]
MQILDFLKLIRYKNLLIIVITQYLMRWCVIAPFLKTINQEMQFSEGLFALLVLATVLIAAAGYAINDYFDIKTDFANHPESVIVGTKISRRWAMTYNNIFNFIGVAIGFWISYKIELINLGFLFLFVSGGLWFYSALYKKQLIIGNIIVALFAAIVPLLTVIYEIPLLNKVITPNRPPVEATVVSIMFLYITGYSIFAFLTTLAREIIKDVEDLEGDDISGRQTIPVTWGIKTSKSIIISILSIILILLSIIYINFFQDFTTLIYIMLFIFIPIIFLIIKLLKANKKADFHFISTGLKGVMLLGLLFSVLLWFVIE